MVNNQSEIRVDQPVLKSLAEHTLRKIDRCESELSIALVGMETIKEMNREYRGIDRATDVLSFNLEDDYDDSFFGDIIISPEVAEANALEMGIDLLSEVKILLVHGILHLSGHDHEKSADAKKMESRQVEILSSFEELMS